MKIGGVEIKGLNEEILVLPRLDNKDIIIRARAVTSMDMFEKMVPEPKAPGVRTRDGFKPDLKDATYREKLDHYNSQRLAYMILKSLEPSDIEWEKVNLDDPSTWLSWNQELKEAGLSEVEVNRIIMCVMQANALDEEKLKAAREVFLHGQEEELEESSGPNTELQNTPSGELAKDSK